MAKSTVTALLSPCLIAQFKGLPFPEISRIQNDAREFKEHKP